MEDLILKVKQAIYFAKAGQSKLTEAALSVPGMTGLKIRHLLNNLGAISARHYLEIGVNEGATFVSTNFGNKLLSSVAVDSWLQYQEEGNQWKNAKQEFPKNCERFLKPNTYNVFEMNGFDLTKTQVPNPVNLYFYDGDHHLDAQAMALTHLYPLLDETFIFLVDDYNDWTDPKPGTQQGIKTANLKILFEQEFHDGTNTGVSDGWWDGFYVSILQKQ